MMHVSNVLVVLLDGTDTQLEFDWWLTQCIHNFKKIDFKQRKQI